MKKLKIRFQRTGEYYRYVALGQSLECMVVNMFVDIKGCKNVESVAEVNISWNGCVTTEDREEVCSMDDGVGVYHGHGSVPVVVNIGLDNPQSIVRIGLVKCLGKPVNEHT